MTNMTYSHWPAFSQDEIDAVSSVLRSGKVNYWTGNETTSFEKEFAKFCGTKYAVALANGTVALELALNSLGIGPGDEVVVTSRTFIASVSSIVATGAKPVFADIDRNSQNITSDTIAEVLTSRTKAIICVHLAGWPCDMDKIMALADENNLYVIEDCAQAHGALYKGKSVGSIGHIGAWSFCQDKIMTTGGEGGMVTTNDEGLWANVWSYKDHGKSWASVYDKQHPIGFRWLHDTFGTNARMTEIQAAIGRIQLRKLKDWNNKRKNNAHILYEKLNKLNLITIPMPSDDYVHAWYKFYIFVKPNCMGHDWSRDRIMKEVNEQGVPCSVGSCSEVYLENAFSDTEYRPAQRLSSAQELGETSLMFMIHPTLKNEEMIKMSEIIYDTLLSASKKNMSQDDN